MKIEPLKWRWSDGFYFAHSPEGMWSIEQHRGQFILELRLEGAASAGADQEMGTYKTSTKAKVAANKAHRELARLA